MELDVTKPVKTPLLTVLPIVAGLCVKGRKNRKNCRRQRLDFCQANVSRSIGSQCVNAGRRIPACKWGPCIMDVWNYGNSEAC